MPVGGYLCASSTTTYLHVMFLKCVASFTSSSKLVSSTCKQVHHTLTHSGFKGFCFMSLNPELTGLPNV